MSCTKDLDFAVPPVSGAHLSYYWTMNEGGDATKIDSTSALPWNTRVGSNSPPALFSNGIEFDTTPAFHGLNGPDQAGLAITAGGTGFSFWFWYKLLNPPTPGDGTFTTLYMDFAATAPPNRTEFTLNISANPATAPAYIMFFDHNDDVNSTFAEAGPISFNPGVINWHMIACTIDKTLNKINIYIDAVLVATSVDNSTIWTCDKGRMLFENASGGGVHPLDVLIDEFGLCLKQPLTPAQITSLYNGGVGVTWPNITPIVPFP